MSFQFINPNQLQDFARSLENKMNDTPGTRSANDMARDAFLNGLAKGGIDAANKRVVRFVLTQFGDNCPEILKTEVGQAMLAIAWPWLALHLLAIPAIGERVPHKEKIEAFLEKAMEAATQRGAEASIQEAIKFLTPIFSELEQAAVGALPDFEQEGLTVVQQTETQKVREQETVRIQ
jgi:hypothetical protein